MADSWKVLGQGFPPAGTLTPLYTVPPDKKTLVSTLHVCNQSTDGYFRVSVVKSGDSALASGRQFIYYDEPIRSKRAFKETTGDTLATGDTVWIWSSNGQMSFNLLGQESDV